MLKVYLVGPLIGDGSEHSIRVNREQARSAAEELWKLGFAVFCPHLNTAGMVGLMKEEQFIKGDLCWLSDADLVVTLPLHSKSKGSAEELAFAKKYDIPIIHYTGPNSWYEHSSGNLLSKEGMRCLNLQ